MARKSEPFGIEQLHSFKQDRVHASPQNHLVAILAMVFPYQGLDVSRGALVVELFMGIIIAVGGMLKL
ncbi:MAG: hypothetical protein ACOC78_02550 [Actinomycetota bacterium]